MHVEGRACVTPWASSRLGVRDGGFSDSFNRDVCWWMRREKDALSTAPALPRGEIGIGGGLPRDITTQYGVVTPR